MRTVFELSQRMQEMGDYDKNNSRKSLEFILNNWNPFLKKDYIRLKKTLKLRPKTTLEFKLIRDLFNKVPSFNLSPQKQKLVAEVEPEIFLSHFIDGYLVDKTHISLEALETAVETQKQLEQEDKKALKEKLINMQERQVKFL